MRVMQNNYCGEQGVYYGLFAYAGGVPLAS